MWSLVVHPKNWFERATDASLLLTLVIYPAYATYWLVQYAAEQPTWPRKVRALIVYIPVLVVIATVWAFLVYGVLIFGWRLLDVYRL